jgi:hypothetical protein
VTVDDITGFVTGGTYTVTCIVGPDCESSDTGTITAVPCAECSCLADAQPITVCKGAVNIGALEAMILDGNATCETDGTTSICDVTPTIDTTDVTTDANGYVTGGHYDAICQPTVNCEIVKATASVTAVDCCDCDAYAPDICVARSCGQKWDSVHHKWYWDCHQYTPAEILTIANKAGARCTGDCSYKTVDISGIDWSTLGTYTYKVICKDRYGECVGEDEGNLEVKSSCPCNSCPCS